jgi:REP element-mobilizing transposase RayT
VEEEQKGFVMARLARVVAVDVPHHVTQRGNARRFILDCDADRRVYFDLLREHIKGCRVSLIGYCLMSNHVHLVLVPKERLKPNLFTTNYVRSEARTLQNQEFFRKL